MSKEEFLKIQTCVLKVNIHCDGCKQKVKKILQKIEGVYTIKFDSEFGKVTVSGNVDPETLIKKLIKNGKHAELWGGAPKPKNHNNQIFDNFKNLQISNGKGGKTKEKGGGGGGGPPKGALNPQFQQMKGLQDLKMLPQFPKDLKMPPFNNKEQNHKPGKLELPEDDEFSDDDEFDDDEDEFDDDDEFDDELDDDIDDPPINKMKPGNGLGFPQMPGLPMMKSVGINPENGIGNAKKGGGGGAGNIPAQSGGKKGGGGGGGGGGKGGGGTGKNAGSGGNYIIGNGTKKATGMNDGPQNHGMSKQKTMGLNSGGPMGPVGSMPNLAAVQGLPAGGPGYFHGSDQGNPFYQQQLAAMMMNQQRANGNERFQPMMYARPPAAVNYMPHYPPHPHYPYPPPPPPAEFSMFSDENASGCSVM